MLRLPRRPAQFHDDAWGWDEGDAGAAVVPSLARRVQEGHQRFRADMTRQQADEQISLCLGDATASLSVLEVEHRVAAQNMHRRAEIERYKRLIEEHSHKIRELEAERDGATQVARLLLSPAQHWDDAPAAIKHHKQVVIAILKSDKDLPSDLGLDAWSNDSTLPEELRDDKDVFLAWLQRKQHGLYLPDGSSLHLSDRLLNGGDDVVARLMAERPGYFGQPHAPQWLFDDDQVFDLLLDNLRESESMEEFLGKLSPRIRNDAEKMIRAILVAIERISEYRLWFHIVGSSHSHRRFVGEDLCRNKEFCLEVARAVRERFQADVDRRRACPMRLGDLDEALCDDEDVAVAFCSLNGRNLEGASERLRSTPGVVVAAFRDSASSVFLAGDQSSPAVASHTALADNALKALEEVAHDRDDTVRIYDSLSNNLKQNPVIAGTACRNANELLGGAKSWFENNKEFWLLFLSHPESARMPAQLCMTRRLSWDTIPAAFRRDPEVAILFSRRHCENEDDLAPVLSDVPNLLSVAENKDLIAIVEQILPYECGPEWIDVLDELEIEWQSNRELCRELLHSKKEFLACLPSEMRTREFVGIALQEPMTTEEFNAAITHDVQRRFPELIADWFSRFPRPADNAMRISPEMWSNRNFVLAWIKAGGNDVRNGFNSAYMWYRNDREVMLALAKHDTAGFSSVCSLELENDKDFMLQAMKSSRQLLNSAGSELARSFDFLLEVISHDSDTVGLYYDDERSNEVYDGRDDDFQGVNIFDQNIDGADEDVGDDHEDVNGDDDDRNGNDQDLDGDVVGSNHREEVSARDGTDRDVSDIHDFALRIRERLSGYLQFRILLLGMAPAGSERTTGPPRPLLILDQGSETSRAYKGRIAEYVGIPTGPELLKLVKASTALARWGY
jgi:hypothetical protein